MANLGRMIGGDHHTLYARCVQSSQQITYYYYFYFYLTHLTHAPKALRISRLDGQDDGHHTYDVDQLLRMSEEHDECC